MDNQFLEMFQGTSGKLVTASDEQGIVRLDFEREGQHWRWDKTEADADFCMFASNMVPEELILEIEAEWGHLAPEVKTKLEIATRRNSRCEQLLQ